ALGRGDPWRDQAPGQARGRPGLGYLFRGTRARRAALGIRADFAGREKAAHDRRRRRRPRRRAPGSTGRASGDNDEAADDRPGLRGLTIRSLRVAWRESALRDYLVSVYLNSGEDNIFFLASGVAFNILLAAVPFVLLLVSGMGYFLDLSPAASLSRISVLVDRLLPSESGRMGQVVTALMNEAIRLRGTVGLVSAVTFVWFSTRLFGSLRAVLALVFDLDRGIIDGKIFDAKVTVVATLLVVIYTVLNAYLAIATKNGAAILSDIGVQHAAMNRFEYWMARAFEFSFVAATFFALYRFLPARGVRARTAVLARSEERRVGKECRS